MKNTEIRDRSNEELQAGTEDINYEESQLEDTEEPEDKISSEESSSTDSTEEVRTSEHQQEESENVSIIEDTLDTTDTGTLIQEVHYINQRLDTMTNILLVSMIGIALVSGILACSIFAKYFHS